MVEGGEPAEVELGGVATSPIVLPLCTLYLASPGPGILATHVEGMGSLQMVKRVVAFGDELIRTHPPIQIFHDFRGVTGYRADARKELVDWGVRNPNAIAMTNVLFRSKVVAMGVTLATALLGDRLTGYSKHALFEAALMKAVRDAR
ncbi:MAG: hypothetical protein AB8I08_30010 [Sandaracinaceae bacterium]